MSQEFDNEDFEEQDEEISSLYLEILDEQENIPVDPTRIRAVGEKILADAGIAYGRVGIVLVDNDTIHKLNNDFLKHDYPTDVISFQVESDPETGLLEGEVIVSVEMARDRGPEFGWGTDEEVLLYVIHGLLHLVGFDDTVSGERATMREKEREYLQFLGIEPNDLGFEEEAEETAEEDSEPPPQAEKPTDRFLRFFDDTAERN